MDTDKTFLSCLPKTLLFLGVFIVGGLVGMCVDRAYLGNPKNSAVNPNIVGEAKMIDPSEIAKGTYVPAEINPILEGTVLNLKNGKFTLKLNSVSPYDKPELAERTITIGVDTKITIGVAKPEDQLRKEADAFAKQMEENMKNTGVGGSLPVMTPIDPYIQSPATIADIKNGNTVIVNTKGDLNAVEFTASEIRILPI